MVRQSVTALYCNWTVQLLYFNRLCSFHTTASAVNRFRHFYAWKCCELDRS